MLGAPRVPALGSPYCTALARPRQIRYPRAVASPLDKILVVELYPLLDGVEQDPVYLTTWLPWTTAATDTPASTPCIARIVPGSLSWGLGCFEITAEGLFAPGGVSSYQSSTAGVENAYQAYDGKAPLDVLAGYSFVDARAVLYLSDADVSVSAAPTLMIALAALDEWAHARVEAFDLESGSDGRSSLRLGPPQTLDTEASWWAWRGFDKALRCTAATRADQASLRNSATSHSWVVIGRWPQPTLTTWLSSPLFRVVDNAGTNTIGVRFKDASGTFQPSGGTLAASTSGYYVLCAVYDVTDDSVVYYADGEVIGTTTLTGGLDPAAASAATTINSSGGNTWAIAGLQHFPIVLTPDEVAAISRRGIEDDSRADLTCKFNEGTGSISEDSAAGLDFVITVPTWPSTGEGEAAWAETKPPVLVGVALGCKVAMVDALNALGTPGYAGGRYELSHVTENGLRRQPIQTLASGSVTLDATKQTITPIPGAAPGGGVEFAQGSQIVLDAYAPGTTPAGNPSVYTIVKVLGRALANNKVTVVVSGVSTTETITTTVSDNSDGDVLVAPSGGIIIRDGSNVTYPAIVLSTSPTELLQTSVGINSGDSSISGIDHTLQAFGSRESSPTIAREASGAVLYEHAWRAPGESSFRDLLHMIARSSRAEHGNGPLGVYYDSTGAVAVRGMWLDMQASDDVYIPPDAVLSVVELEASRRARPGQILLNFQRNWAPIETQSSGLDDRLENELHKASRQVKAGTSGRVAAVESSLAFFGQARLVADALLRLQGWGVYIVRVEGPLPAATLRAATNGPFLQTSVEWPDRDTWTTARTGIIVGATATPLARPGEPELEFIFATGE